MNVVYVSGGAVWCPVHHIRPKDLLQSLVFVFSEGQVEWESGEEWESVLW